MAKLKKIQAATLIETLIAMVVASVVFGIAFSVYLQVAASSTTGQKMKAFALVEKMLTETKREKRLFDEEYSDGGISITKTVSVSSLLPDLVLVQIVANDEKGKKVANRNILFLND